MPDLLRIVLPVCAGLAVFLAACTPRWNEVVSDAGRFEAVFEGPVDCTGRTLDTASGPIHLRGFMNKMRHLGDPEGDILAIARIEYSDLTQRDALERQRILEEVLEAEVRDQAKSPFNGKVAKRSEFRDQACEGIETDMLLPNGFLRTRACLSGGRLYLRTILGPEVDVAGPKGRRFFDSFRTRKLPYPDLSG